MAYQYNKFKPNIEQPKTNDNSLLYKDHDEFFVKFYELRTKLVFAISQQAKNYTLEGMKELYVSLNDVVEWTCDYINIREIDPLMLLIDEDLNKLSKIQTRLTQQQLDPVFKKLKDVWRRVSKDHTKNELIPKVQENLEEEDPFGEEKNTAKKTMYKVVMKLFENV